jgi:hypothetical protein
VVLGEKIEIEACYACGNPEACRSKYRRPPSAPCVGCVAEGFEQRKKYRAVSVAASGVHLDIQGGSARRQYRPGAGEDCMLCTLHVDLDQANIRLPELSLPLVFALHPA